MSLFRCIKKKPETRTELPQPNVEVNSDLHVALVVGHNQKRQGAVNYLDESEWVFNSRIAKKVQAKLKGKGVRSTILFRPTSGGYRHECRSVASEASKAGCTHAISLHFNSAGKGAKGAEVLVAPTHTKEDDEFAKLMTDLLNERYGTVERGDDGMKTVKSGHNGYGMLNELNKKGMISCLVEPCFGDYRTAESKIIFEQEDKYVQVLVDTILKAWQ